MNGEIRTGVEGARYNGLSALHAFTTGEGITESPHWAPRDPETGLAPDPGARLIEITGDPQALEDIDVLRARIHELYDAGDTK